MVQVDDKKKKMFSFFYNLRDIVRQIWFGNLFLTYHKFSEMLHVKYETQRQTSRDKCGAKIWKSLGIAKKKFK